MPAIPPASHQAQIGVFHNAVNSGQVAAYNERQLQGLLGISNTSPHRVPGPYAVGRNQVYEQLSIPMSPHEMEGQGSRITTDRLATAMKQHPWATGILVTTAILAAVVVARQPSGGSEPAVQWLDDVPQPQPLIMTGSASSTNNPTIVDICQRAIGKFPRTNGAQVSDVSIAQLQSIKSDAQSVLGMALSMARDSEVRFEELDRAAQCSGVSLRQQKVEAMIANLRARKLRLEEERGGLSINMAGRILALRMQTAEIDRRLAVLTQASGYLFDATVALNSRMLEIAG